MNDQYISITFDQWKKEHGENNCILSALSILRESYNANSSKDKTLKKIQLRVKETNYLPTKYNIVVMGLCRNQETMDVSYIATELVHIKINDVHSISTNEISIKLPDDTISNHTELLDQFSNHISSFKKVCEDHPMFFNYKEFLVKLNEEVEQAMRITHCNPHL